MKVKQGDIVVVSTKFQENPTVSYYIKRVIGVPGDEITIRGTEVFINGEQLDEPYITKGFEERDIQVKLNEDEYWIMGDNRDNSIDSRNFGAIKKEYIYGKVIFGGK